MKSSAVVISKGKKETNLFLAMHKSYFLKGSKLVKIFIGVSSVFLKKKTSGRKQKASPHAYLLPFLFTYEIIVK